MQLGELEKQVLKYLWKNAEADVKQVHQAMSQKRQSSLNTVQSAVERLFRKGLLTRRKLGHAFLYQAKVDKEGLISQLIETVTNDFVEKGESSLLAAFSSVSSRMDESELDALERLIEQQRALRKSQ
ncbi:BlaI/MecI/CopY family transcriptional regulator [uncultured Alteromonas sp.]|jgi:predicted transcriptional regulator|uniref:BlaI/MecI/CopY family transcriptional regulator n=1 Tax=uncultured Alteromonas sp. TaxID=179113 RepID=UPI0025D55A95|nr:BlaI/MecI/CopY family transcriptional regulator [uncultured Alteromonas sp.]